MATKQVDRLGFDRIEIANVRRCFSANATNYKKLDKLYEKIRAIGESVKEVQAQIDAWEAPVKTLTEQKLGKVLSSRDILLAHTEWDKFVEIHPEYAEKAAEPTAEGALVEEAPAQEETPSEPVEEEPF